MTASETILYVRDVKTDLDGAKKIQWHHGLGSYRLADSEVASGSTLGAPKVCAVIKASGALEKIYSIDAGAKLLGSFTLQHWDEIVGMRLAPLPGHFALHPEHQEHTFMLSNGVTVHEDVFVLNRGPRKDGAVDPAAVYVAIELTNDSQGEQRIASYAFCELDGNAGGDVAAEYDSAARALVAWNAAKPEHARMAACSRKPASYEVTFDHAKALSERCPGALSGKIASSSRAPLGVLQVSTSLQPGESSRWYYRLSVGANGKTELLREDAGLPDAASALAQTHEYYYAMLDRSVVLTPNPTINRGAQWAKANMLRVQTMPPTGWGMTNSPTCSNNSVARDAAWFAYGSDYFNPEFSRATLLHFVKCQKDNGMIVEFYDMLDDTKTGDFGLNINDDTPLLVLALWHHYQMTGDEDFLREIYPCAAKAVRYIDSQRNAQGLVWCTAEGTGSKGIIGWRNVIKHYRLSGATTEVNSECYAAFAAAASMARIAGDGDGEKTFDALASSLKDAINTHLYNPANGLYYLNIDVDGVARTDVTSDLVFPIMFGVASAERSARIVRRLSDKDFWTSGGMRTAPHDAPSYSAEEGSGLLGGVWNGVTFWYAKCAARFTPAFMDEALTVGFENYSRDPIRNNTVPGQFSEWLHGETLVNQGMSLSPWFPPRYLWAAIEGALGLSPASERGCLEPNMAPDWSWSGIRNMPYHGKNVTWFAVRAPNLHVYSNFDFAGGVQATCYDEDISKHVNVSGDDAVALGLRNGRNVLTFVGSTSDRSSATGLRVGAIPAGSYEVRKFDSLRGAWENADPVSQTDLARGIVIELERKGFQLLELRGHE